MVLGQVLSGMGGVGKTQLAAHHARTLVDQAQVDLVVWIPAGQRTSILAAYAQAAHTLLSGQVPQEPEQAAARFLGWLHSTDKRWLVVLDNLDDPQQIRGLWPPASTSRPQEEQAPPWWQRLLPKGLRKGEGNPVAGRVTVTTRRADLLLPGSDRALIKVGLFTPEQSLDYLTRALNQPDLSSTEEQRAQLAEELGHLPLALSHAAAYIRAQNGLLDCAGYLDRFRDRRRDLHRNFPEDNLPEDYPWTVAATWAMSIEHANTLTPQGLALPLIRLIGLLDSTGIPVLVLTSTRVRTHLAVSSSPASKEPVPVEDVRDVLAVLQRLHLISIETGHASENGAWESETLVTTHRIVQRAIRDHPATRTDQGLAVTAGDALVSAWPDNVHATNYGQRLRDNAESLINHAEHWLWEPKIQDVLFLHGRSIGESGATKQAVRFWERMLRSCTERVGPEHRDTLKIHSNLATWRAKSGDLTTAKKELETLLITQRRTLGPRHIDTLANIGNLASLRAEMGDVDGAIADFRDLLRIQEEELGDDHIDVITTRINLATWRMGVGDTSESLVELESIIRAQSHTLGKDHERILATISNLASLRARLGDINGAIVSFQELLKEQERMLGSDHPNTLTTRSNIASWRAEKGDLEQAINEFRELLQDRQRILGFDHPDTLITRNNLATWRAEAGDLTGSIADLTSLFESYGRVLGWDHPDTMTVLNNMAICRARARDTEGAISDFQLLLESQQRTLGVNHPDLQDTRNKLRILRGRRRKRKTEN